MKKANTRGLELLEDARAKCIAAADALDELSGELQSSLNGFPVAMASNEISRFLVSCPTLWVEFSGSDGYDGPEYSKDAAEEDRELQREGDRLAGDRE